MGPTWVLLAPGGPHIGPMNLAISVGISVMIYKVMTSLFAPNGGNVVDMTTYAVLMSLFAPSHDKAVSMMTYAVVTFAFASKHICLQQYFPTHFLEIKIFIFQSKFQFILKMFHFTIMLRQHWLIYFGLRLVILSITLDMAMTFPWFNLNPNMD